MTGGLDDRRKALDALRRIHPSCADDRDSWLKVGMALHSVSEDLLDAWDEWSRSSEKYEPGECARQWRSFRDKPDALTIGSLIHWANEDIHRVDSTPTPPRPTTSSRPRFTAPSSPTLRRSFASLEDAAVELLQELGGSGQHSWSYSMTSGSVAFGVVRIDHPTLGKDAGNPKTYRPFHCLAGSWVDGDPDGPLPLYQLPELIDRTKEPVFVVEGEKCAEAVRALGLLATTSAHGSSSAKKSDWNPLAGRDVVFLPDHDSAGKTYQVAATSLIRALRPRARVRVVSLPGLSEGEDVVDFIERHRGLGKSNGEIRNELLRLVTSVPVPGLQLQSAKAIKTRRVEWLWESRIAARKLNLVVGDPDLGKTLVVLDVAARFSSGRPMPGSEIKQPAGKVLIVAAEDDPSDTLVPRLMAAEANLENIQFVSAGILEEVGGSELQERAFTIDDIPQLEEALDANPEIRLIIIDPITAYMGQTDTHRDSEVRAALVLLGRVAQKRNVTIVAIMHLNKKDGGDPKTRITGSLAFVAIARSAQLVGLHRDDTNKPLADARRVVARVKSNLTPDDTAITFTLDPVRVTLDDGSVVSMPRIVWGESCRISASSLLVNVSARQAPKRERAEAFLLEHLRDGPKPKKDLLVAAAADGIEKHTLENAARSLGLLYRPADFQGPWTWELSPQHGYRSSLDTIPTTAEIVETGESETNPSLDIEHTRDDVETGNGKTAARNQPSRLDTEHTRDDVETGSRPSPDRRVDSLDGLRTLRNRVETGGEGTPDGTSWADPTLFESAWDDLESFPIGGEA